MHIGDVIFRDRNTGEKLIISMLIIKYQIDRFLVETCRFMSLSCVDKKDAATYPVHREESTEKK